MTTINGTSAASPVVQGSYCSSDDLDRYLSSEGITAFADHDQDGSSDSGVVADCIDQATNEIDAYVFRRYAAAEVDGNRLLKRWATVMACRFLTLRRGNMPPESLEMEFQRITDPDRGFLSQIAAGKYRLPDVQRKLGNEPTFSNLTVDRRYPQEKIRVKRKSSSPEQSVRERDNAFEGLMHDG